MLNKHHITKLAAHIILCSLFCIPLFSQTDIAFHSDKTIKNLIGKSDSIQLTSYSAREFLKSPNIDSSLYILLPNDMQGYAVVATNENGNEVVVAFSAESEIETDNLPPAFVEWMQTYSVGFTPPNIPLLYNTEVQPLLGNTKWGQDSPYNRQCPMYNGTLSVTGCVATAMAQIMRYYKYPEVGHGIVDYHTSTLNIHVKRDLSNYHFQWEKMRDEYPRKISEEDGDAVAALMASCGASVLMDYSPKESGAFQKDLIRGYVRNFIYDDDCAYIEREFFKDVEWHSILQQELINGRPVNYSGSSRSDGGHSFVLDGFTYDYGDYPYYHVNWGWNGSCDGYYLISSLLPKSNDKAAAKEGFSQNQSMVIGVQPLNDVVDRNNIICSSQLSLSSNNCRLGQTISFHAEDILNCSYRFFSGDLSVYIANAYGDTILAGSKYIQNMAFMEKEINVDIVLSIPQTAKPGNYEVIFTSSQGERVYSRSNLFLSLFNRNEDEPLCSNADLSVSELKVVKNGTTDVAIIRAYELYNSSINDFAGRLYIGITDSYGNMIMLADSAKIDFIESFSTLSDPISFNIPISSINLQKGTYNMFLFTLTDNTYTPLMLWKQDGNNRILEPISLSFEITESYISIDGVKFETGQSEVLLMPVDGNNHVRYGLDGIIRPSQSRLIIIDGKKHLFL